MNNQEMQFIRLSEVVAMTGVSESTIYDWIKKGLFPRQVKLLGKISAWEKNEVLDWMNEAIAVRDAAFSQNQPSCLAN